MLDRKKIKKPQFELISTPTTDKNIEELKKEVESY